MPTFDFQCRKCNHIFEFSRPFGITELPSCTACGSKRTEKLIAPPAVHFKGSGWYKTDSRIPAATPKTTPKKDDVKSGDATSEAKPAETKTPDKKEKKSDAATQGTKGTQATEEK